MNVPQTSSLLNFGLEQPIQFIGAVKASPTEHGRGHRVDYITLENNPPPRKWKKRLHKT